MRATVSVLFRILGALAGAAIFVYGGLVLNAIVGDTSQRVIYVAAGAAIGAIAGFIVTPRAIESSRAALSLLTSRELGGFFIGMLTGLLAAALFSIPLAFLPNPARQFLPVLFGVTGAYLGAVVGIKRADDLVAFSRTLRPQAISGTISSEDVPRLIDRAVLLDTSVIIDGRIADVSKTSFLNAKLIVPSFVLHELQNIADSPDPIRRKRGRRGLDILEVLRTDCPLPFEITDLDVSEVRDVDTKLVALARHLDHPIMTNDYNLNRVAGLQGVNVLNINDLANAIKAAFLPGEPLLVKVIQEGREYGQGVGYLDDGTMVVVEDGSNRINQSMDVIVTKVLQTSAGRMIFARIADDEF